MAYILNIPDPFKHPMAEVIEVPGGKGSEPTPVLNLWAAASTMVWAASTQPDNETAQGTFLAIVKASRAVEPGQELALLERCRAKDSAAISRAIAAIQGSLTEKTEEAFGQLPVAKR